MPKEEIDDSQTFRKLIQIGRVVYLNEGPYRGKLAVVVDIIDCNKALIDGPCSGVPRQAFKFSEMFLTKYLLKINRSQRSKILRNAWEAEQINEKFAASKWNQNLEKEVVRSNMTDFDRYKLGRARQSRNRLLNRVHNHIRKQHFKALRVAKMKKDKKSK
ncbi:60S ribosomal protein L14-like isoform X1 [Portunus trituberculatus]|uniref:60S ribosomal protein L14-like isoform X1 n=1 Tax=Portunus trituberculatus TaxID=210409 RepID=UPI001E1CF6B6|nr:60S ribosomal protein L14-like isoform X1 [Portunus trituberculatus]